MSATISASQVKELRAQTGAGMMDVKNALVETNGDMDAAKRLLREKGMAQAGKRADRTTSEGIVLVTVSGGVGAIAAVGCETEPVSKNGEDGRGGPRPETSDGCLHNRSSGATQPRWGAPASSSAASGSSGISPPVNGPPRSIVPEVIGVPCARDVARRRGAPAAACLSGCP